MLLLDDMVEYDMALLANAYHNSNTVIHICFDVGLFANHDVYDDLWYIRRILYGEYV